MRHKTRFLLGALALLIVTATPASAQWINDRDLGWVYFFPGTSIIYFDDGFGTAYVQRGATVLEAYFYDFALRRWVYVFTPSYPWFYDYTSGEWAYFHRWTRNPRWFWHPWYGQFHEWML
jgi:hypothetical protein